MSSSSSTPSSSSSSSTVHLTQNYHQKKFNQSNQIQEIQEIKDNQIDQEAQDQIGLLSNQKIINKNLIIYNSSQSISSTSISTPIHSNSNFSSWNLILEILPSLIFSVIGGILTGELLEIVQNWLAFIRVPELYILLPVLMNLKGNLEMNLTARLTTSANVGQLDKPDQRRALVLGNLTLLQLQALIVSFFASFISFVLGLLSRRNLPSLNRIPARPGKLHHWKFNNALHGGYHECLLVLAAGMLAASLSSAILGSLMSALVIISRNLGLDPDNIAPPIASSLSDLMSLIFLSLAASVFIKYTHPLLTTLILGILISSIGLNLLVTAKNTYVQKYLAIGWLPLFIAMLISICSGLVLEKFITQIHGFATIAPVLTGICGNIGSISVSRISTALHSQNRLEPIHQVGSILMLLSVAILSGFASWTSSTENNSKFNISFFLGFTLCAIWCSLFSLVLANVLTNQLWNFGYDPDVYAIPLLSSIVDLVGQLSLVLTYSCHSKLLGH
ncbi:hypothetical protein O181_055414 [Austropuccinia psidii MF-1]|uniref:SLC41A/MgtE integral membrane domain-containing protein n=1 Tax=Austropuccinia psidii MF-1 TaxID=1389203 RepID=A0A9Q3E6F3_9BASI|nr:hypothetical protein [Austropuccinia psidii MF-1]